jgi:transcriptional regulator with XRE-family HTH domain
MKTEAEILGIIRSTRISKSLSQAEFAEQIGLSQSAYAKLEKGITALSINRLNQILNALEIDYERLFVSNNQEKKENFKDLMRLWHILLTLNEIKIKSLEEELEKIRNKKP